MKLTCTQCSRKMDTWVIPLGNISLEPFGPILANGTDAYNGSFNSHQVRSLTCSHSSMLLSVGAGKLIEVNADTPWQSLQRL